MSAAWRQSKTDAINGSAHSDIMGNEAGVAAQLARIGPDRSGNHEGQTGKASGPFPIPPPIEPDPTDDAH